MNPNKIKAVTFRDRVMVNGTMTTAMNSAAGVKFTLTEHGIDATWEDKRKGLVMEVFIPDDNIVWVEYEARPVEPKGAKK